MNVGIVVGLETLLLADGASADRVRLLQVDLLLHVAIILHLLVIDNPVAHVLRLGNDAMQD